MLYAASPEAPKIIEEKGISNTNKEPKAVAIEKKEINDPKE